LPQPPCLRRQSPAPTPQTCSYTQLYTPYLIPPLPPPPSYSNPLPPKWHYTVSLVAWRVLPCQLGLCSRPWGTAGNPHACGVGWHAPADQGARALALPAAGWGAVMSRKRNTEEDEEWDYESASIAVQPWFHPLPLSPSPLPFFPKPTKHIQPIACRWICNHNADTFFPNPTKAHPTNCLQMSL